MAREAIVTNVERRRYIHTSASKDDGGDDVSDDILARFSPFLVEIDRLFFGRLNRGMDSLFFFASRSLPASLS